MSGKNKGKQGGPPGRGGNQTASPPESARRSGWQRFLDGLRSFFLGEAPVHPEEARLLNKDHDRRPDYSNKERESEPARRPGELAIDVLQLHEKVASLEEHLGRLQMAMEALQRSIDEGPDRPRAPAKPRSQAQAQRPSPFDRDPSWDELPGQPFSRPSDRETYRTTQASPSRSATSRVDLETLERAVCRFLGDEPGTWQMDRLLDAIQISQGGSRVDVQHLGSQSADEWRLAVLWPPGSNEGLAVVSSGELADDEISQYFDIDFGRRILACRQPARVSRQGADLSVLRKGKVASS